MDDRSGSARWKHWASYGALATATLGGEAEAVACHEDPDVPGYEQSSSVALTFGVSWGKGGLRASYGLDFRWTRGQRAGLVRLEGRGDESLRLVVAGHLVTKHEIAADERRHADLAWAILDWTWREGGARVRDAIAEAAGAEPEIPAASPQAGDPELLAAGGRISPAAARAAAQREMSEALDRVRRLIG
jgi:hypothetical protein